MHMDYEYPIQNRDSEPRAPQPVRRKSTGKGGRYLKEDPRKHRNSGRNGQSRHRRRKLNPRFVILLVGLVGILIGTILLVRSCNKPTIVGRWDVDGNTYYCFHDDGTGVMETDVKDYSITYKIEDNVLQIHFVDNIADDLTYTFELKKDALFLTGGPGDAKGDHFWRRVG